jgi:hypothetical protein
MDKKLSNNSKTPLLDTIDEPADLRRLEPDQLRQVADELRQELIDAVSITGGHLGAGLGVVELTVALHYLFETPNDRLIWDVGHQAYPHKILTGAAGRASARCARAAGSPGSPGAARASTIRSGRPTARPRSPPASAWRWRATSRARIATSWR